MKNLFVLGSLFFALTAFTTYGISWNIASDYVVKFEGKGAKGTFSELEGTIDFDPANLSASSMNVSVAVATIETGNNKKNEHARSEKWFNAAEFPKIKFASTSFDQSGSNYKVTGNLEIRGITKEVEIPFTFSEQNGEGLFEGAVTVNRKDFGIEGPWFSFTVAEELLVGLKVPVTRLGE